MIIAFIALFDILQAKKQLARAWFARSCFHIVTVDVY
jgi:hypothetical protein